MSRVGCGRRRRRREIGRTSGPLTSRTRGAPSRTSSGPLTSGHFVVGLPVTFGVCLRSCSPICRVHLFQAELLDLLSALLIAPPQVFGPMSLEVVKPSRAASPSSAPPRVIEPCCDPAVLVVVLPRQGWWGGLVAPQSGKSCSCRCGFSAGC